MRFFLFLATLLYCINSYSQITLEHTYNNSNNSSGVLYSNYSFSFNTENATYFYCYNSNDNSIKLYDEYHTLYKSIKLPIQPSGYISIYAASDKLFNSDSLIELIVMIYNDKTQMYLINENGSVINDLGERSRANIIKTSSGGFKLITSKDDGKYIDVYTLTGTLSNNQYNVLNRLSTFPNPSNSVINIIIPDNFQDFNEVIVYDFSGNIVLSQKKNTDSKNIISLDISSLAIGTYIYKMENLTGKFIKK